MDREEHRIGRSVSGVLQTGCAGWTRMNNLEPWNPPKPREIESQDKEDVLRHNTFAILGEDAPVEEKLLRMVALVPMALEVVDEARETIRRLREENDRLKGVEND